MYRVIGDRANNFLTMIVTDSIFAHNYYQLIYGDGITMYIKNCTFTDKELKEVLT